MRRVEKPGTRPKHRPAAKLKGLKLKRDKADEALTKP